MDGELVEIELPLTDFLQPYNNITNNCELSLAQSNGFDGIVLGLQFMQRYRAVFDLEKATLDLIGDITSLNDPKQPLSPVNATIDKVGDDEASSQKLIIIYVLLGLLCVVLAAILFIVVRVLCNNKKQKRKKKRRDRRAD